MAQVDIRRAQVEYDKSIAQGFINTHMYDNQYVSSL